MYNSKASWPLESGERLLWEGAPDPAPTKSARRISRRLLFWAALLFLIAAVWIVLRLTVIGGEIVVHAANPSLEAFSFEAKAVDFNLIHLFIIAAVFTLTVLQMRVVQRRLGRTRCAVTDCRVLVRCGTKVQSASFADAPGVLWQTDDEGRRSFFVCHPLSKPALSVLPGGVGMGPFDAKTAADVESLLRKVNGFPQQEENDASLPCHRFPFWADAGEREAIAAHLLPGERLLWYGRSEPTPSKTVIIVSLILNIFLGAIGLLGLFVLVPSFPDQFRKGREILQLLFIDVGGPLGWLMGFVMGLFTILYFSAPFILLVIPLLERNKKRQTSQYRHLVTDHRAWTMRLGNNPGAIGGAAIVCGTPVVLQEFGGCFSVAFLSAGGKALIVPRLGIFPTYGFAELSESDAHAAAEALNALRRRLD